MVFNEENPGRSLVFRSDKQPEKSDIMSKTQLHFSKEGDDAYGKVSRTLPLEKEATVPSLLVATGLPTPSFSPGWLQRERHSHCLLAGPCIRSGRTCTWGTWPALARSNVARSRRLPDD